MNQEYIAEFEALSHELVENVYMRQFGGLRKAMSLITLSFKYK